MATRLDFFVDRQDFDRTTWQQVDPGLKDDLAPGQVRLALKSFVLTSNNITYARCGDLFGYWRYFPAPAPWGSIPVWGLGQIVKSRHDGLAEGENIYGYFPMSSHLTIAAARLKATGFVDASAHRADLPRTYNEYVRIDHDRTYDKEIADAHLVLRPLHSLAFFLAHFLADAEFFNADCLVISSASSKVAMALAFQVRRQNNIAIFGLTSGANRAFLDSSGLYDAVLSYSDLAALNDLGATLYVDIAGNESLRAHVHRLLDHRLRYSCGVGFTHGIADAEATAALPGPKPEFFFTPQHILARRESWGPAELRRRLTRDWRDLVALSRTWLTIERGHGPDAIAQVYAQVLNGKRPPDRADILAFEP